MPIPLQYVAIQTDGRHPATKMILAALGELKEGVRGVEETSKHLVFGMASERWKTYLLNKKVLKIGGKDFALKSWPLPDTVKVRLKKVGLEVSAEEIRKAIAPFAQPPKIVLETCKDAPAWRNGHAHFFLAREAVVRLPKEFDLFGRKVKVSIPTRTNSPKPNQHPDQGQTMSATAGRIPTSKSSNAPQGTRSDLGMGAPFSSSAPTRSTSSLNPKAPAFSPMTFEGSDLEGFSPPSPLSPRREDLDLSRDMDTLFVETQPTTPELPPRKRPRVQSPIGKGTSKISLKDLEDAGITIPKKDAILVVHEGVSQDADLERSQTFDLDLGGPCSIQDIELTRKGEELCDRFRLYVPDGPSTSPVTKFMSRIFSVGNKTALDKVVHLVDLPDGSNLVVVFKTRYDREIYSKLTKRQRTNVEKKKDK